MTAPQDAWVVDPDNRNNLKVTIWKSLEGFKA